MNLFLLTVHIIVTYIKENIIIKLQKSYKLTRNLWLVNKLPVLFLKKPLFMGDLYPGCKILIERADSDKPLSSLHLNIMS